MMFRDASPIQGGLATGIPGEIAGYWEAYKLAGRLPWHTLFQPSIRMCRNGFHITKTLARVIAKSEVNIRENEALSGIFINKVTNETYKEHETIKMPNLARTLELISRHNVTVFYDGRLARLMVQEINQNGGKVSLEDFRKYRAVVTQPVKVDLDSKYSLYTSPLPSSGVLVPFIMKIMNGFDLKKDFDNDKFQQTVYYHRLVEVYKHAYAHRSLLGDNAKDHEIRRILKKLDDDEYIEHLRSKISDFNSYPPSFYGNKMFKEDRGTAHISILADGDAVSLTSSINT